MRTIGATLWWFYLYIENEIEQPPYGFPSDIHINFYRKILRPSVNFLSSGNWNIFRWKTHFPISHIAQWKIYEEKDLWWECKRKWKYWIAHRLCWWKWKIFISLKIHFSIVYITENEWKFSLKKEFPSLNTMSHVQTAK